VFCRGDGTRFPVEYTTTPISEGDSLTGGLVVFRNITERRRIESELVRLNTALAEQARRDPLTGLGNRLRLEEDLVTYDARRVRYGHSYCVLLCDLDHFKALNDRQGHQAGDHVLREIAHALGRESRTSDAVYRYGGEAFLVLLAEQTLEGAMIVCERMRKAVERLALSHSDNEAGVVTISIGAAACPQDDRTDPADAIRRADRALYAAKGPGPQLRRGRRLDLTRARSRRVLRAYEELARRCRVLETAEQTPRFGTSTSTSPGRALRRRGSRCG
jgi:diguanylate cyclase (GGDEF)-like protein